MSETDHERSEAFVKEYYALCRRHGVHLYQRAGDALVAVPLSRSDCVPHVDSLRAWQEERLHARLGRDVRSALHTWFNWHDGEQDMDYLSDRLDHHLAEYDPDTHRELLEAVVAELRAVHPELFGGRKA